MIQMIKETDHTEIRFVVILFLKIFIYSNFLLNPSWDFLSSIAMSVRVNIS